MLGKVAVNDRSRIAEKVSRVVRKAFDQDERFCPLVIARRCAAIGLICVACRVIILAEPPVSLPKRCLAVSHREKSSTDPKIQLTPG